MSQRDHSRELYPFLYEAAPPTSAVAAQARAAAKLEARRSTVQKCDDIVALRAAVLDEYADEMLGAARAMARRFQRGGTLLAFGNGGSATDAQDAEADCLTPPYAHWRSLPALALTADVGVLTAITNDVGFERVFMRQIIAFGGPDDLALGFSTSGNSRNVVEGLREARQRGMLSIAIAGNDGGEMAATGVADHCFVARSEQLPRIQEAQATIWHAVLELVQFALADASSEAPLGLAGAPR